MANIPANLFTNWNNGETMTEADYEREREILRTAINDNYTRLTERYTKAEIDSIMTGLGNGMALSIRVSTTFPSAQQGAFLLKTPENTLYYHTGTKWIDLATSDTLKTVSDALALHKTDTTNPHNVTPSQIGAIAVGEKGQPSGVATLGTDGLLVQKPFVTGTYTGDGTASRLIALGLKPKALIVVPSTMKQFDDGTNNYFSTYGGIITENAPNLTGSTLTALSLAPTGFNVFNASDGGSIPNAVVTNANGYVYTFIAFR